MTQRALYLHSSRHCAIRAALLGAASEDRATESAFLIYLANLLTLAYFTEAALGFFIAGAALRALDRVVDKTFDAAQKAAGRFWRSSLTAAEALSQTQRRAANEWFDHTLYSRLNDKQPGG